ncbi:MAG: hypothetical protein IJW70_05575 [Clostridia bacterium]|nr:hypothetical protein [Clostridia bacterium]
MAIDIEINTDSTLLDLLNCLVDLFEGDKKVQIDLRETNLILVKSVACAHCGKSIPIYKPLSSYVPENVRCERCMDICSHASDSDEPIVKTVTNYSLRASKKILDTKLAVLGIVPGVSFRVSDQNGKEIWVVLRKSKEI